MDTDKALSTGPDDAAGDVPEDIRLMRGLCGSERQSRSLTHFAMVYLSRSVPNAKSHLVTRIQTPSPSPHRYLSEVPRPDRSHKSVPIKPDWSQWASSHRTPSHRQNSSQCSRP